MTLATDITFDTPHGELQDVRAEFDLYGCYDHRADYDPDSASAKLLNITLGEYKMSRVELVQWIGAAMVAGIEDAQVDAALSQRRVREAAE